MTTSNLKGKTVVIIGGSIGIGLAVGKGAQAEGAKVILASSTPAKLEGAVAELGGAGRGIVVDVTDEAAVARFFDEVGAFDHLVYTAGDSGHLPPRPVTELDLAEAEGVFSIRFWCALAAIKHGCRHIAPDGSIILTDGTIAHRPIRGQFVGSAMLGAVEHLVAGLAFDLAPIRVNGVCPGLIGGHRTATIPEERLKAAIASLPMKRMGKPDECAEAYLYLMRAGYTTGQVVRVDGGSSLI
ncbi:MAG: SDR family oxidoreductase [Phenylobacterium sp.]